MANCSRCGQMNAEGQKFCTSCGASLDVQIPAQPVTNIPNEAPAPQQQPVYNASATPDQAPQQPVNNASAAPNQAPQQPVNNANAAPNQAPQYQTYSQPAYNAAPVYNNAPAVDEATKPLSVGGFVGTMLLSCIPIAGFIYIIVCACGGTKNVNRQNYARASLIIWAITLGIMILLSIILIAVGASLLSKLPGEFFYDFY